MLDAMSTVVTIHPSEVTEEKLQIAVAKAIWAIAGISPEHGNAVMDVVGIEGYQQISDLQKK